MIQAFPSECTCHSFDGRACFGTLNRGEYGLNAEPSRSRPEAPTVATVAIPHEVFRLLAPGRGLNQLSPDSLRRGVGSYVQVNQPALAKEVKGILPGQAQDQVSDLLRDG